MAKLSAFEVDVKAIADGEWIRPGEEWEDLEIQTRGYTDAYHDAQSARTRRAAMAFNGDPGKIPNATLRSIRVECLIAHALLDVRNLADADGQPVSFSAFCDMLRNPKYPSLLAAAQSAAAQVGRIKAADVADAVGN